MNTPPVHHRNIILSRKNSARRVEAAEAVAPDRTSTDKPQKPFFDRRKSDRRAKKEARGHYDSRSGKDRRKRNLGHPSIRTQV